MKSGKTIVELAQEITRQQDAKKDYVAPVGKLSVEVVGKKHSLAETERKGVLARLIEGADFSRYGLHSAITRHAADVDSYDRATELERLGGTIIELPRSQWHEVLKQAA